MDDEWSLATVVAFLVIGIAQIFPELVPPVVSAKNVVYSAVVATLFAFFVTLLLDEGGPPTWPEGRA